MEVFFDDLDPEDFMFDPEDWFFGPEGYRAHRKKRYQFDASDHFGVDESEVPLDNDPSPFKEVLQ